VPIVGCHCEVCTSADPKDRRFRTSAFIVTESGTNILIDIGPDFREQALKHHIERLDGVLITHSHQDHIGGLDELRQINFVMKKKIDIFGTILSLEEIERRYDYIFKETQTGGGKPQVNLNKISDVFNIKETKIIPIPVLHGEIPILGFRIGGLSYITDASFIPEKSMELLNGTETLVINALRFDPHPTHFGLAQAVDIINLIRPRQAYLIHLTHQFSYERDSGNLPAGIHFAYDGLQITFN
jgi:phosphoribosyl 1,2-cyclic phosphate phosphodiesterase